jgi:hypothetical protein
MLLSLDIKARFIRAGAITRIRPTADGQCTALPYADGLQLGRLSERYDIPEAHTVARGPWRYRGFPEIVFVLVDLGLQNLDAAAPTLSWSECLAETAGCAGIEGEVRRLSRHAYAYFFCIATG